MSDSKKAAERVLDSEGKWSEVPEKLRKKAGLEKLESKDQEPTWTLGKRNKRRKK